MSRPHPALFSLASERPIPPLSDARALVVSAAQHRMSGLLWSRIEAGEVAFPPDEKFDVATKNLANIAFSKHIWSAYADLVEKLDAIGVEVAIAKGVATEACWYDRMGERPSRDLDLFLSPDHLDRVGEIAEIIDPGRYDPKSLNDVAGRGWVQWIDLRIDDRLWCDLHLDIMKLDVPWRQTRLIWDRAVTVHGPGGEEARTLDAETSLVHFLLHANKDRFSWLLSLADVVRVLRRAELDWDWIEGYVSREGYAPHLFLSLGAVCEELNIEMPVEVEVDGWRKIAWQALWPKRSRLRGNVGWLTRRRRQFGMPFLARGRSREGLAAWRRRVLPPRQLLQHHHDVGDGPYLWELTRSRLSLLRHWHQVRTNARRADEAAKRLMTTQH